MNNHPTAKPTYDFYDTTNIGKIAIGPASSSATRRRSARRSSRCPHRRQPARRELPRRLGDVALALAGADRELPRREHRSAPTTCRRGRARRRRPVLGGAGAARSRPRARRPTRSPWTTRKTSSTSSRTSTDRGRSRPTASSSARRRPASRRRCRARSPSPAARSAARGTSLGTFNHENMHQWFGDNVSEARVQPHVLEGGLRHARRVPHHRAPRHACRRRDAGGDRPSRRAWSAGSTARQLQHDELDVLDDGAVEPDRRQPVHDGEHVHAARHRVPRAVADPHARRDDRGDEADPVDLRRREHHRAAARGRVPQPPAGAERVLQRAARPRSSRSGSTPRTRAAAASTSRSSPVPA